jgi:hypothetical protein
MEIPSKSEGGSVLQVCRTDEGSHPAREVNAGGSGFSPGEESAARNELVMLQDRKNPAWQESAGYNSASPAQSGPTLQLWFTTRGDS